jgi:hypothetical protein
MCGRVRALKAATRRRTPNGGQQGSWFTVHGSQLKSGKINQVQDIEL